MQEQLELFNKKAESDAVKGLVSLMVAAKWVEQPTYPQLVAAAKKAVNKRRR